MLRRLASDERLAGTKAQLDLKPEQLRLWNAVADAAKSNAQTLPQGMAKMRNSGAGPGSAGMMSAGAMPDRLARAEAMRTANLDALRRFRAAVAPFYASLTPAQKATADKLRCSPMAGGQRP